MADAILTQERIKQLFHYDENTGIFTKQKTIGTRRRLNKEFGFGYLNQEGDIRLKIDGKEYKAHRLAWLYVYGELPIKQIDHINGIRTDNSIKNLRLCTNAENQQNQKKARTNNKSGLLGVFWCKRRLKWCASIRLNKKLKHIGYFEDKHIAHQAYLDKKREIHPFSTI